MKDNLQCSIARDLLPLYFDGMCSDVTRKQLEEHMEHCEECRKLKQNLEADRPLPESGGEWDKSIMPLKKIRRKIRRKNGLIAICVFFILLLVAGTSVLTYGQIARKGISFEWLWEAARFRHIGRQFAGGDIEPLYEALSNGYRFQDAESGIVRLAYKDAESYDRDMKEVILEKYHQYFDGKELTYKGIENIEYWEAPSMGWNRTLCISLRFEGQNNLIYFMTFYRDLDGQYLVDDYFGSPYITLTSGGEAAAGQGEEFTDQEGPYHTEDSLFSCLSNGLKDYDLYLARYIVMLSGQRALQGDTKLTGNEQMKLGILSQQDLTENTDFLRNRINDGLARLTEQGYYLTDITWTPLEYDKSEHLYRYRLNMELTGPDKIVLSLECYRISDQLVYIPGTEDIYGDNISSEVSQILENLCE